MGCYIWYSEEGTARGRSPPRPLLAVPNVTAHPSTASVPITVLLYNGPLLGSFNVPIKGLIEFDGHQHCGVQRRYLARKRTNMPLCNVDSNVRKNLIIDNVQRTNDVSVTSETSAARPSSPLMNSVHRTDEGSVTPAYFDSETHAGLLAQPRLHFQVCLHQLHFTDSTTVHPTIHPCIY